MAHDLPAIDADGHVLERRIDIRKYLESPWDRRDTAYWPPDQPWDTSCSTRWAARTTVRQLSPADEVAFWLKTMDEHGDGARRALPDRLGQHLASCARWSSPSPLCRAANDLFAKEYNAVSPRRAVRRRAADAGPRRGRRRAAPRRARSWACSASRSCPWGLPFGAGRPDLRPGLGRGRAAGRAAVHPRQPPVVGRGRRRPLPHLRRGALLRLPRRPAAALHERDVERRARCASRT